MNNKIEQKLKNLQDTFNNEIERLKESSTLDFAKACERIESIPGVEIRPEILYCTTLDKTILSPNEIAKRLEKNNSGIAFFPQIHVFKGDTGVTLKQNHYDNASRFQSIDDETADALRKGDIFEMPLKIKFNPFRLWVLSHYPARLTHVGAPTSWEELSPKNDDIGNDEDGHELIESVNQVMYDMWHENYQKISIGADKQCPQINF